MGEPSEVTPHVVVDRSNSVCGMYYHKGQWHRTREEAVEEATAMRAKRIKSLERQLTKLVNMSFD